MTRADFGNAFKQQITNEEARRRVNNRNIVGYFDPTNPA
jgi:hypothetical protein